LKTSFKLLFLRPTDDTVERTYIFCLYAMCHDDPAAPFKSTLCLNSRFTPGDMRWKSNFDRKFVLF